MGYSAELRPSTVTDHHHFYCSLCQYSPATLLISKPVIDPFGNEHKILLAIGPSYSLKVPESYCWCCKMTILNQIINSADIWEKKNFRRDANVRQIIPMTAASLLSQINFVNANQPVFTCPSLCLVNDWNKNTSKTRHSKWFLMFIYGPLSTMKFNILKKFWIKINTFRFITWLIKDQIYSYQILYTLQCSKN